MEASQFLPVFLPLIVYLLNIVIKSNTDYVGLRTISSVGAIMVAITFGFMMAFSESDYGDKLLYANFYNNIDYIFGDYKDFGWELYVRLVRRLVDTDDPLYFFCITALIYVGSYCYYGYKEYSKEYWGYFVVIATGMFGFYSYGIVTIRCGFALGMVLIAMANRKWYSQLPFFLLGATFHKSILLVVVAYYFAKCYNNVKVATIIWGVSFIVAAAGFSILPYMDALGGFDHRIDIYAFSENQDYNRGFRMDFITYSLIPMLMCLNWIVKFKIDDEKYKSLLAMYILVNAFWLLVITMPYTNRISYLSWFLIPILITYPFLKDLININKQRKFDLAVVMLLLVRILLAIRE